MSKDEIIARQAEKIIELEDKLAESNEMKNSFIEQWQEAKKNSIKSAPLSFNETVGALAHAEVPKCPTMD